MIDGSQAVAFVRVVTTSFCAGFVLGVTVGSMATWAIMTYVL